MGLECQISRNIKICKYLDAIWTVFLQAWSDKWINVTTIIAEMLHLLWDNINTAVTFAKEKKNREREKIRKKNEKVSDFNQVFFSKKDNQTMSMEFKEL